MTNPTLFSYAYNSHQKLKAIRRAFPSYKFSLVWNAGEDYAEDVGYWIRIEHPVQPMEVITVDSTRILYETFREQIRDLQNELS